MSVDDVTRSRVKDTLTRYAEFYRQKNVEGVMSMLAAEYFAFGSGPDEVAVNLEDARRHTERDFAQAEAISVQFGEPMIGSTGDTAWFACDCTFLVTIAGQAHRYDGRMSGVLRKSGDRWLIAMNHFAIPPSGQEAGKSYPDAK